MTVTFVRSPHQTRDDGPSNPELQIIARLNQITAEGGPRIDPSSTVNLYEALKAKPMVILTGMAHSGKFELIRTLVQTLMGDDPFWIAVDLAIAQTLLPRAADTIRSLATLRDRPIHRLYPFLRSVAFIENLN